MSQTLAGEGKEAMTQTLAGEGQEQVGPVQRHSTTETPRPMRDSRKL